MAFDKTKPEDTEKIRHLGMVIRLNWEAIESGDSSFLPRALNLINRSTAGVTPDPTVISNSVIVYSKSDSLGKPQLFSINPDAVITQLTGGGTDSSVQDLPGKLILANGIIFIWGRGTATSSFTARNFDLGGFPNNCFHISGNAEGYTAPVGFAFSSKTAYLVKCATSLDDDIETGSAPYLYFAIGN